MLAIGRALMTNPKLLILDEATEGLAPLIRAEIWDCLAKLRAEQQSILVIDKNVDALMRLADRHVVIEKGRVVWTGTSADLAARRRRARALFVGVGPFDSCARLSLRGRASKLQPTNQLFVGGMSWHAGYSVSSSQCRSH